MFSSINLLLNIKSILNNFYGFKNRQKERMLNLVQVSKEIFQEMLKKGILQTDLKSKNFTITCKGKSKGSRKKHYVSQPDYMKYIRSNSKKSYPRGRC